MSVLLLLLLLWMLLLLLLLLVLVLLLPVAYYYAVARIVLVVVVVVGVAVDVGLVWLSRLCMSFLSSVRLPAEEPKLQRTNVHTTVLVCNTHTCTPFSPP